VDGGCKSAVPEGSATAVAVATPPLFKSGDSAAGTSAAGFALAFFVETLGINKIKLVGLTGFQLPGVKGRHALDARWLKKFKMDYINRAFEAAQPQYGKGNFAVNSLTRWRILAPVSNPIFHVRFSPRRVL
jgi:hypothetical protein